MRTGSGRGAAQGAAADNSAHGASARHRAETTLAGSWLVLGKDGRLTAYARARTGLLRWTQTRPGGAEWTGPDLFPVSGLTDLHVVQGKDTYVHFLGRREVPKTEGPPAVDVVHAIQYQTGRPVTEWRSLGNPHKDAAKAARFGRPTGAVSAGGNVHVFARNAGGGVMLRRELAGGKWSAWTDLKGRVVREPVAVVAYASGHVEALAGGQDLVMRWTQEKPDGNFGQAPTVPLSVAPGSAVGLETGPDRATYYWTDPETGGVVAHRPGGPVIPLDGAPAEGPVAVLRVPLDGYDCTVLARRDGEGRVLLAACGTENEEAGVCWAPTRERCVGTPALARDAHGRVVLGVIDPGGALRIARQNDETGLALAPSVAV
ncbi:hypothetical protein E4N62_07660 [Streptomyces sp. MNU76]|uniref:hypothetical protein n=1 Tax=Streptomyces sp. MNU76 TaxID=2560026 RepID=UPI001E56C2B5|nr:hypothetical protein [Streptomyces sp. MNU76]MCC9705139.1 hypothetical protein [Streptomyces sp. MNU76]